MEIEPFVIMEALGNSAVNVKGECCVVEIEGNNRQCCFVVPKMYQSCGVKVNNLIR